MADLTHLPVARESGADDGLEHDHWGGVPVPRHVRVLHEALAGEYLARLERDPGEAVAYLHKLRYEPPPELDVWRFIDALAAKLAARKGR